MTATTNAKLADGQATTLLFGARYIFGISGPAGRDDVVAGKLESRAANGDLVVLVDSSGTTKRVRPSKILSVYGDGVDQDAPPTDGYVDAAGYDLDYLAGPAPKGPTIPTGTDSRGQRDADAARQAESDALVEHFVAEGDRDPDSVAAKVHAELGTKRSAKPYSERNQVWKCSVCKGRTRKPVCTGHDSHPPVSAPAGKRRDDR